MRTIQQLEVISHRTSMRACAMEYRIFTAPLPEWRTPNFNHTTSMALANLKLAIDYRDMDRKSAKP